MSGMHWELGPSDLLEAVKLLADKRGYVAKGNLRVSTSKGDPPWMPDEVGASIEIEPKALTPTLAITSEDDHRAALSKLNEDDRKRVVAFIQFLNEHEGRPLHEWPSRTAKLAALILEVRSDEQFRHAR